MSAAPQATLISGERLHLHHGPIDLIIGVEGDERTACFIAATKRFQTIMTELVSELPDLRGPLGSGASFKGAIAKRMADAVSPFDNEFVTPMAAVAGAVADEVLCAMLQDERPMKAYVNNGGDIAIHLDGPATFDVLGPSGKITLSAEDCVRGIATSGWRGRSHSLGIADAVTVLARSAAEADVAATLVANAVDLPGHPQVERLPASTLNPDSDLGERLVTAHVGQLVSDEIHEALAAGQRCAEDFLRRGLIESVALSLQGRIETLRGNQSIGEFANA